MWLASCKKLVTSVAMLRCVERGLLDLDEDFVRLLTDFKEMGVRKGMRCGRQTDHCASEGEGHALATTHALQWLHLYIHEPRAFRGLSR